MSGIFWPVFTFSTIFIFLVVTVYRLITIARLPNHLRWELAPIPHEKAKGKYGGSYLEEHEWWRQPRHNSITAPVMYMLREIFLMRGIWKNNRTLWPFSLLLHAGIYLFVVALVIHVINAIFIATGVPTSVLDVFQNIASGLALAGYLSGGLGAITLMLKRRLDGNYRPFTTPAMYFRLVFLGVVFVSGIWAWFGTANFGVVTSNFMKDLFTLKSNITASVPLSVHIIIALLFIVYLPFTDMLHFIAKYFTYHAVRWNDAPMNVKMEAKLRALIRQPAAWSAPHAGSGKSWAEIAAGKPDDAEKT
jgi:nitrate reductase gamma subunit